MINKLKRAFCFIKSAIYPLTILVFFSEFVSFIDMQSRAEVVVEKFDGMIDWDRASNYKETEQNLRIARGIYAERKRRKQLQDAHVSEVEIEKIIQKERADGIYENRLSDNAGDKNNKQIGSDRNANESDEKKTDIAEQDDNYSINGVVFNRKTGEKIEDNVFDVKNRKSKIVTENDKTELSKEGSRQQKNDNQDEQIIAKSERNNTNSNLFSDNIEDDTADLNLYKRSTRRFINADRYPQKQRDDVLNVIPSIPVIKSNDNRRSVSNDGDFEISRMLRKADENVNNRENFVLFAKEVARIANTRTNRQSTSFLDNEQRENMKDIHDFNSNFVAYMDDADNDTSIKNFYITNNDKHGSSVGTDMQSNFNVSNIHADSFKKTNNNDALKSNVAKRLGNMYATTVGEDKRISNKKADNKIDKVDKISASKNNDNMKKKNVKENKRNRRGVKKDIDGFDKRNITNDLDEDDFDSVLEDNKNDNNIVNNDSLITKQIQAKNIGAPMPMQRQSSDKRTQYQPQNISQVSYDKNNKHLKPAVFESHVISQVFDNLGSPNAIQIARALINEFGKTDFTDENGNTLLMHAIARRNQSLIAMLLSEGASPNQMNNEGFAPIHLAASNGDNVAMYSLMMGGADSNLRDKQGNTALMYASKTCNADTLKLMISLGGDPLIVNPITKKTAFDFAMENPDPSIITLLKVKKVSLLRNKQPVDLNNI